MPKEHSDEHTYQRDFKAEIEKFGGMAVSLSGSMFMAGMPDLLCISSTGNMLLVENKIYRNIKAPASAECVHKLLKGPQQAVIKHKLWRRNAACIIVAQSAIRPSIVHIAHKSRLINTKWIDLAKIISTSPLGYSFDLLLDSLPIVVSI